MRQLSKESEAAQKLITKLERRYKKLAFTKYYRQVQLARNEAYDIQRGKEARQKLSDRLIARTYKKFIIHTQHMLKSKQRLLIVVTKQDLSLKDECVKHWLRYVQFMRERKLEDI